MIGVKLAGNTNWKAISQLFPNKLKERDSDSIRNRWGLIQNDNVNKNQQNYQQSDDNSESNISSAESHQY